MFTWISGPLLYVISEWTIRIAMLVVITRRRRPSSAQAWLLLIFFLPWPGFLLYLIIGQNRLPRHRLERHARLLEELRSLGRRFQHHPSILRPKLTGEARTAVALAERLGNLPILSGNDFELIPDTDAFIDRLIADIDTAEHHVHLLFYIFAPDRTGLRVTRALKRAVRRGVKCRVLVDAAGSRALVRRHGARLRKVGVQVHEALPVSFFRRRAARIDLRNHRKLAVIDGRVAYTGSQNIVNADYGKRDLIWRDLMARLTGPIVLELQVVFFDDWSIETGELLDAARVFPEPQLTGGAAAQVLPSGPNYPTENYQRLVVAALHAARQRVTITTPYFVPDATFMQAIETAVLRGVEVEMIVPRRCDQILVGLATRAYFSDLLEAGVDLHLHERGLLHAKTMTVDDEIAFFGTSNFDIRSFALNFEINLVFYGVEEAAAMRAVQDWYIGESSTLTHESWGERSAARRVLENIAKLFSPLL